jgi:hypothetical protein
MNPMREFYQIVMNITGTFVFLMAGDESGNRDQVVGEKAS